MKDMNSSNPQVWWEVHDFSAHLLSELASKLLSQPSYHHVVKEIGTLVHKSIPQKQQAYYRKGQRFDICSNQSSFTCKKKRMQVSKSTI